MYIVTGGAGFIGSCIVSKLIEEGITDILVVDHIGTSEKWKNVFWRSHPVEYMKKTDFLTWLAKDGQAENVELMIHMGACSSTTEQNFDYLYDNNFQFTKAIWEWCTVHEKRMIYASSAATYGDGVQGFCDEEKGISELRPLNGYGISKQIFDMWALGQTQSPPQWVGLKFFNVYGPNEYHKGSMASVVFHTYNQIRESGKMKLFKSYLDEYPDGGQLRDFVYVMDIVKVIWFLIENKHVNGIYNIGTGRARSFYDLAKNVFLALELEPAIEYVDMPEGIREKYQYYTQAEMLKLRNAGYQNKFYSLEEGVCDYVSNYLAKAYRRY
nr:ADP-glyceromanno-heptose 6-epimerase [uncultured Acetatifactor sp.]